MHKISSIDKTLLPLFVPRCSYLTPKNKGFFDGVFSRVDIHGGHHEWLQRWRRSSRSSLIRVHWSEHSDVRPSVKSEVEKFNVSVVDAWPSRVTEGLGQVTGLAVDSAGRLFVFHRSERTWDYEYV